MKTSYHFSPEWALLNHPSNQHYRSVRSNHIELMNMIAPKPKDKVDTPIPEHSPSKFFPTSSNWGRRKSVGNNFVEANSYLQLAKQMLDDLDWSLNQLSTIKTSMSVSDMARNKFKSMINKQFIISNTEDKEDSTNQKSNCQTQEFIFNTFLNRHSILSPSNTSPDWNTSHRRHSHDISLDYTVSPPTSGDHIPKFGISCNKEEELESVFMEMDNWGMDIFRLDEITDHQPLTAIVYRIFLDRNLLEDFKIPKKTCVMFLTALEASYLREVPYHNSKHAADVTQTTQVLLKMNTLEDVFTPLEILSALFAAAIHDAGHPGVTNQYLVNTSSELALLYNDESVLENYHVSTAFKILQKEECNILSSFGKQERQTFRKMVIDLVLATDMSKHMTLLADMKTMLETKTFTGTEDLKLDDYSDRMLVLQTLLHCADLSNPAKPLPLYVKWCGLIMEEFFQQGDKERKSNMEISPMCDRFNAAIERTQVGFIDFVVRPVWETWADLVNPDAQEILDTIESNKHYYQSKLGALRSRTTSWKKNSLKEEDEVDDE